MASSASAQQPAQQRNALKEFEARMLNMVARLDQTDTIFFFKRISKSMATEVVAGPFAYSLEFPHEFFSEHGKKFGKDVIFVTTDNHGAWPINITLRSFRGPRVRLFAYGLGGWKSFVMDNHIKVGDILIFKLLRWSHFEVVIGRSPANRDNAHEGNTPQASLRPASSNCDNTHEGNAPQASLRAASSNCDDAHAGKAPPASVWAASSNRDNAHEGKAPSASVWAASSNRDNAHEDNAPRASLRAASSYDLSLVPKFLVTIYRPSEPKHPENHFYLERDLRLIVPSHFWELHSRMLERDELQLKGPTKTISNVKVEKTYNEAVPKVCLGHSGWKTFLLANNLAVGDVLEFSLVANSSFTIDVVEQIENH